MSERKDRWMIVKVQVSIFGKPATLIYNRRRDWWWEGERKAGEEVLGNRLKGFWRVCHKANGELYFHEPVADRSW